MWNMLNTVAGAARHRMMPQRRSGMGTMTALFIGASVGIAAWEAVRQMQGKASKAIGEGTDAMKIAQDVMSEIQE
ncbi:hypothetical protein [Alicyclobacillus acidiphilus]|uniref:hypothetical protein n=1 Tax=Alicyclobacillus acidiphilus TaxID=182455 RepID=UPI0008337712|nr:hypothetical protein [Alicyclobacillus acidiphilus]